MPADLTHAGRDRAAALPADLRERAKPGPNHGAGPGALPVELRAGRGDPHGGRPLRSLALALLDLARRDLRDRAAEK